MTESRVRHLLQEMAMVISTVDQHERVFLVSALLGVLVADMATAPESIAKIEPILVTAAKLREYGSTSFRALLEPEFVEDDKGGSNNVGN